MPTMEGIANVLNHIGAHKKGKQTRILWHSLREEPVRTLISRLDYIMLTASKPLKIYRISSYHYHLLEANQQTIRKAIESL
jgi:hypothetical protein